QHIQGDFRADSTDGINQEPKQLALGTAHKSIEHVSILAHDQVRQELQFLARLRELVIGVQGNERLVTHPIYSHDDPGGKGLDELAVQESNHGGTDPRSKIRAPTKSQIPNPKSQTNPKLQIPKGSLLRKLVPNSRFGFWLGFGVWDLGFPCGRLIFVWAR